MRILRQLTLRNLQMNRKRTIVTLIGIILSGALICGVATLLASFQDAMIRGTMYTSGSHHATLYGVPYENTKYITNHANTEKYMFSRELGFAYLEGSKNTSKPYLWVHAYDDTAFEHFPVHLKEGRFPQAPNEMVVSQGTKLGAGVTLKIGDTLTLTIGKRIDGDGSPIPAHEKLSDEEQLTDLSEHTFIVTGILEQPNVESYTLPAYGAVTWLDRSALSAESVVDVSLLAKKVGQVIPMVDSLKSTVQAEKIGFNSELLRWMGVTDNNSLRKMFYTIGLIIILLVVIGSITVIYNAFAISVSERKKQFGMLASVGATARQIRHIVFFEAAVLGVIGIPIGILSGIGGIWVTLEVVNDLMKDFFQGSNLPLRLIVMPETIWISIMFIGITIFLSAYIPAKRAARISPVDAIRLTTDIAVKGRKLRTSRLSRLLFGIEGELALKNLKRHRKRYRATVFSLFISIVLYLAFSSFMIYGFASSDMYYESESYNFTISKHNVPKEDIRALYEQIVRLDPVEDYVITRSLYFETVDLPFEQLSDFLQDLFLEKEAEKAKSAEPTDTGNTADDFKLVIKLVTVNEAELARYAGMLGFDVALLSAEDKPRGILVNYQKTNSLPVTGYKPLNMQPGEELTMRMFPSEDVPEPEPFAIELAAISDEKLFSEHRMSGPSAEIFITEKWFDRLMEQYVPETYWETTPTLYLNVAEGTDTAALTEEIRMIDASLNPNGYFNIWDTKSDQEEMRRAKLVFSIFLYGFVTLIALIGVTNIFNTISTNVALRRREFAMLKSVGLTPAGFSRMLNYECIFYGVKALLYGLPVGLAVSYWLYYSISNVFSFHFTLPWREIIVCIVSVFVIVFLTMLHSSSKMKKENIIDALKIENL